jgi:hypothetical protein
MPFCRGTVGRQLAVRDLGLGHIAGELELRESGDIDHEGAVDRADGRRSGCRRTLIAALPSARFRRRGHIGTGLRIAQCRQHAIDRRGIVLGRSCDAHCRECTDQRLVPVDVPVGKRGMREFDEPPQAAKVGKAFYALATRHRLRVRLRHRRRSLRKERHRSNGRGEERPTRHERFLFRVVSDETSSGSKTSVSSADRLHRLSRLAAFPRLEVQEIEVTKRRGMLGWQSQKGDLEQ